MDLVEILGRELGANDVHTWLLALATAVVSIVALWIVKRFLLTRLYRLARHTENDVDDLVADLSRKTHTAVIIILAFYAGSLVLALPQGVEAWLKTVAIMTFLVQVGIWGNTIVLFWVKEGRETYETEEDGASLTTINAFSFLLRLIFFSILLLLALDNIPGVEVTALIASLGVGGIAVALAVQSILGDLFASLSIALDKPFVIGDFIVVGDYAGTVQRIGLKSTRLRSLWGEQLVFSNSDLLSSRIQNFKNMEERRISFTVGVTWETPPPKLRLVPDLIREAIETLPQARFDRAHLKELGDFSLNFEIVYYVLDSDYNVYMDSQQAINLALLTRFAQEGIDFAYPTQKVFVNAHTLSREPGKETAVSTGNGQK